MRNWLGNWLGYREQERWTYGSRPLDAWVEFVPSRLELLCLLLTTLTCSEKKKEAWLNLHQEYLPLSQIYLRQNQPQQAGEVVFSLL